MTIRIGPVVGLAVVCVWLAAGADAAVPRMDDGKPDFSGTYDLTTLTPSARPEDLGERKTYTDEEAAEIKRQAHSRVDEAAAPSEPDRPALSALEGEARTRGVDRSGSYVPGSHDYFWFDCGGQYCDLFKLDGEYRTSILIDPPNGRLPAVTEAGNARRATLRPPYKPKYPGEAWWLVEGGDPFDNPEGMSMWDRCLYLPNTVPMAPGAYNNMRTIVQSNDTLLIINEWMHWSRLARIGGKHRPDDVRSLSGDPIGWWEGDTLVVETTNFLQAPGVPREGLRIVERFSPIDEKSVRYQYTVHDADYEAPYTGEFPLNRSEQRLYEYACHEGNYAMSNTLRGARELERRWIEKNGPPPATPAAANTQPGATR